MKPHFFTLYISLLFSGFIYSQGAPKREFRGAWIQVVNQNQYAGISPTEMEQYFTQMLDRLQACHINTLIFQVRPAADAFYHSAIEPWSRYLTGTQGKAPLGNFDPMAFLVEETHKRNMEFHAWLNPYRVTTSESDTLCPEHIYYQHPERFIKYGKQIYFDPGIPENRKHICAVIKDIVSRYDVDAIHMDDYFYPYPISGKRFEDENSFNRYAHGQGFEPHQLGEWRRNNINLLIAEIKHTIILTKPWVRFGVSPFGIYRNKRSTPDSSGSNTTGLQNYDNLYADVLLWTQKGWVDYIIPQLYWEIGHSAADYDTLIRWWSEQKMNVQLYIGQDIVRTVKAADSTDSQRNQLPAKMLLARTLSGIGGNCWWSGYNIIENTQGIADSLGYNYQKYPALIPAYVHQHKKAPKDVKQLKAEWMPLGYVLHWQQNGSLENPENAQYYVIYRFENREKPNLTDPSKIVCITRETFYLLPYDSGKVKYKYVVTSVDRFHNETKKGKSKKVKL
ncbi:MAG: family 10 glycosylhydrolase [Dysgonamonadaceae bacterium]|nr:family 10 glycosylhydrolase [Dysgonamonadaceae bacterium]